MNSYSNPVLVDFRDESEQLAFEGHLVMYPQDWIRVCNANFYEDTTEDEFVFARKVLTRLVNFTNNL